MPRNSGVYSLPEASFSSGVTISSSAMNSNLSDIASALTNSIAKNGETTVTGNINMGSKKLTSMAVGSANTDSLTLGQAQNSGFKYFTSSGTNTITGTLSPAITAYAAGQEFVMKAGGTNTAAATINLNSVGAVDVLLDGSDIPAGYIVSGKFYKLVCDGTNFLISRMSISLPPKYHSGLGIDLDTDTDHDIAISPGICMDSADADIIALAATLTKQIDANWAAGDDAGGFPSGLTLSTSTWYNVFVIRKDDGTIDGGFDTSASAANLLADATDYTQYKRVGSVLTDGSSNIKAFTRTLNRFMWDDPPLDVDVSNQSTSSVSRTLSVPPVAGIMAIINALTANASAANFIYIRDLSANDEAAGTSSPLATIRSPVVGIGTPNTLFIGTNSSGQVGTRSDNASTTLKIATLGYIDPLGRDW